MRLLLLVIFLGLFLTNLNAQSDSLRWYSLEEVQLAMKEQPRKVLIDVTADWCKWCKVMEKETFSKPEVINYINEYYYAVKMDYESLEQVQFWIATTLIKS